MQRTGNILSRSGLALLMLGLAACATQPKETLTFDEKFAQLKAEHKYGAAMRLLEANAEFTTEQRESEQESLGKTIVEFEKQQHTQASQLQKQKQYGDAIALYQQALLNYPESLALREHLQGLYSQRDNYVETLQLTYLVDRAKSLEKELATVAAISDAQRENTEKKALLDRLHAERDSTALALLQEGQRRLALKEIKPAMHYLQLSQRLKADERTETALRLAKRQQKPRKVRRVVAKPKPVAPSELDVALSAYQDYLDNNQLRKALLEIRKAVKLAPEDSNIRARKVALDKRIDKLVDVAIEEGKLQYSQGNINAAIERWQAATVLAPYNDALKERLAKAIRFRERYEALRE
jgi:tetratricopeptide (TPR) repeat protein